MNVQTPGKRTGFPLVASATRLSLANIVTAKSHDSALRLWAGCNAADGLHWRHVLGSIHVLQKGVVHLSGRNWWIDPRPVIGNFKLVDVKRLAWSQVLCEGRAKTFDQHASTDQELTLGITWYMVAKTHADKK